MNSYGRSEVGTFSNQKTPHVCGLEGLNGTSRTGKEWRPLSPMKQNSNEKVLLRRRMSFKTKDYSLGVIPSLIDPEIVGFTFRMDNTHTDQEINETPSQSSDYSIFTSTIGGLYDTPGLSTSYLRSTIK